MCSLKREYMFIHIPGYVMHIGVGVLTGPGYVL